MDLATLFRGWALALLVTGADQATKFWALDALFDPPAVIRVTGFFNLVPVWNTGVSFGMLGGGPAWTGTILMLFALAVAVALSVWLARGANRLVAASLGLIIGGAIGNAIDRGLHGAVVDFLDFHAMGYHWPAFNIADSAITVGVGLMILDAITGTADAEAGTGSTDPQEGRGRKDDT